MLQLCTKKQFGKLFTKKDFDGLGVRVRTYELGIFIVLVVPCTINLVY